MPDSFQHVNWPLVRSPTATSMFSSHMRRPASEAQAASWACECWLFLTMTGVKEPQVPEWRCSLQCLVLHSLPDAATRVRRFGGFRSAGEALPPVAPDLQHTLYMHEMLNEKGLRTDPIRKNHTEELQKPPHVQSLPNHLRWRRNAETGFSR